MSAFMPRPHGQQRTDGGGRGGRRRNASASRFGRTRRCCGLSALRRWIGELPAPADSISLENKLAVTKLLHRCGATIDEINCIRKHLSRVKGGRLAEAFHGKLLVSLITSDVVGDPLDVIASGPTSPDPTTFADALAVIARFGLKDRLPESALDDSRGAKGEIAETPKSVPSNVVNRVIGSNRLSLDAAAREAAARGYCVLDLGSFIEGETRQVAIAITGVIRSIQRDRIPIERPACILIGGETTVTLGDHPGKGGRNSDRVGDFGQAWRRRNARCDDAQRRHGRRGRPHRCRQRRRRREYLE